MTGYELQPSADLSEASLEAAIQLLETRTKLKSKLLIVEVSVHSLLNAVEVVTEWNLKAFYDSPCYLTIRPSRTGPVDSWAVYMFDDYVFSKGA